MKKIIVFLALMLIGIMNCYAQETKKYYFGDNLNTTEFNIDTTYNGISFKVYNEDTGDFLKKIYLNTGDMKYKYAQGLNIRFVEDTYNSAYEALDDIIVYDESKIITVERIPRYKKVTIKTIYRGYAKYIEVVDGYTDVTIYDENFNQVFACKIGGDCVISLLPGTYFFKDNKFGFTTRQNVLNETTVYLSRYYIDGIYSEEELDLENVTRKGKLYYFNDPVFPEDYITINGEEYDMGDKSKYYYIFLEGIFYKYSKKDEVINDDDKNGEKNEDSGNKNDETEKGENDKETFENRENESSGDENLNDENKPGDEENNEEDQGSNNENKENNEGNLDKENNSNDENDSLNNEDDNQGPNDKDNSFDKENNVPSVKRNNEKEISNLTNDNNESNDGTESAGNTTLGGNEKFENDDANKDFKKDENITIDEEILIDVPNTEISTQNIIYFKNKYYFKENLWKK